MNAVRRFFMGGVCGSCHQNSNTTFQKKNNPPEKSDGLG